MLHEDFEEVHCLLRLSQRLIAFNFERLASFMGALFSSFVMEQLVINGNMYNVVVDINLLCIF